MLFAHALDKRLPRATALRRHIHIFDLATKPQVGTQHDMHSLNPFKMPARSTSRQRPFNHGEIINTAVSAFIVAVLANSALLLLSSLPLLFHHERLTGLHHYLGIITAASIGWVLFCHMIQLEQERRGRGGLEAISDAHLTLALAISVGSGLLGNAFGEWLFGMIGTAVGGAWRYL